jgi:uncharacterized membrane protein
MRADGMASMFTPGAAKEPSFIGMFFGSYLFTAGISGVLIFAGIQGYEAAKVDPANAGLLIAPPSAAALLIVSFLTYRFLIVKKPDTPAQQ